MKKVINSRESLIEDMLNGFVKANSNKVTFSHLNKRVIKYKDSPVDKIGVVVGGGSGHEPLFLGYLGENMADVVAVGNIFAAPSPQIILDAIREADNGHGVICIFGNYSGDVLNFDYAKKLALSEGIKVENLAVTDDIASAPKENKSERRGIAGDLLVIKGVCAATANKFSFERCVEIGKEIIDKTYSLGVGLSPGTNPVNGQPSFHLKDNEIEFGLGLHGEPGVEKSELHSAKDLVNRMFSLLEDELNSEISDEIVVCINGLGSTTLLELYTVANELDKLLTSNNYLIFDYLVGSFSTSQEMAGFSITIQLLNEETKNLYALKADSVHFKKGD